MSWRWSVLSLTLPGANSSLTYEGPRSAALRTKRLGATPGPGFRMSVLAILPFHFGSSRSRYDLNALASTLLLTNTIGSTLPTGSSQYRCWESTHWSLPSNHFEVSVTSGRTICGSSGDIQLASRKAWSCDP